MAAFDPHKAERKIHFYRAVRMDDPDDASFVLDRDSVKAAIQALKGTDDFYLDEGDDKITAAEVVGNSKRNVKLYGIRRNDLPSTDDGTGTFADLALKENEGLAESIHIGLYPSSFIVAEYFHHGPRISRFQTFLNDRCGQNVLIRHLIRGDVVTEILKSPEIRAMRLKLSPSVASTEAAKRLGLTGAVKDANAYGAGHALDVTLQAGDDSEGFGAKVKEFLRSFRRTRADTPNLDEFVDAASVYARDPNTNTLEDFNLLSDKVLRVKEIKRKSKRSRALDEEDAFRAINQAYNELKDKLPDDGLLIS